MKIPQKRLAHLSSLFFSVLIFALSIWAINQELRKYHIHEVWNSLLAIPAPHILLAVGLTALNYVMLTGYDTLAIYYIRHPLPYRKTALAALISYAISNSVGLALLSGTAIRYRLYRAWGLSVIEIAQIVAFCNLSFWLGLFSVGGVVFLVKAVEIPQLLNLPFTSVHPLGVIFLMVVIGYLLATVLSRKSLKVGQLTIPHLPLKLSLAQITVTSLDWALAATVLYVILPPSTHLSYLGFFGIYLLAQIAGIISNVPGGLGVFETVMLLLLSPALPSEALFGALLVYRGIYYFLPLVIAVLVLGLYEFKQRSY
ncbi:lysylphosphatidylglycerol synthase domain-containing protein [Gloeothece verrucosa]|uniref:Integral membrane protein-like protein n=1 Tax=Gloeothece verrucosa (strain PCC 7822) TaxID=497965 RepID=E0UJT3_GLOV7|nr:lysylphosphatidylglycerol synthase domain-containing protein [Gloeothece verrucosa]ADN13444.1 conserved hypothetical protein [Gloeothece verrucosa PCC 7822]